METQPEDLRNREILPAVSYEQKRAPRHNYCYAICDPTYKKVVITPIINTSPSSLRDV